MIARSISICIETKDELVSYKMPNIFEVAVLWTEDVLFNFKIASNRASTGEIEMLEEIYSK